MNKTRHTIKSISLGLVIAITGSAISLPVYADRDRDRYRWDHDRSDRDYARRNRDRDGSRHDSHHRSYSDRVKIIVRHDHHKDWRYRPVPKHKNYHRQHHYPYYRYVVRTDNDFFKYLAFTAITWKILDILSDNQRRKHEEAMSRAMDARVGESIIWDDKEAAGVVTTTRTGVTPNGQQCREFQQVVTIGGKTEEAYGTACRQSDGSWQIVQ